MFVLSEKHCSMLLFPFINSEGDDLVECVVLPEIPIWGSKEAEEGALLNRQLLVVILLFCAGRDEGEKINVDYKYQYPSGDVDLGAGTKKSVIKARIQSVEENLIDLLERAATRKAKANEEIATANEEIAKANEELAKANEEIAKMATRAAKQEQKIQELEQLHPPEPMV